MADQVTEHNAGWTISRSVALELDVILSAVRGYFAIGGLPSDVVDLVHSLPRDWQEELPTLLGESRRLFSVLEWAADLADTIQDGDYGRVTLAIRELSVQDALARVTSRARDLDLAADPTLAPAERLVDLWLRQMIALYVNTGFDLKPEDLVVRNLRQGIERIPRILRGGDLHARFWHWLDRFYYGFYSPWRESRAEALASLEMRAITALGARERVGVPPALSWLPQHHPLHMYPELASAVQAGRLQVVFVIEPFGMSDLWSLLPGRLLVSFAEPGILYQNFQAHAQDLADRVKALADPTRLIILRGIRHFSLINTEMANALGLSRPTVSVHAKILRQAGLIESHREGREMRHQIVPSEVHRLFRDLQDFLDLGDDNQAD
jgi:DNA-binding transcriptional ArsR family regulator